MDQLQTDYPEIAEVEVMGGTHEGRQIRGLRVYPLVNVGRENVPIIFLTAGASARDWIAVMTAVNVMHELAEHYEQFQNIIDNVEWFIIPVANPDGYEFSRLDGVRNLILNETLIYLTLNFFSSLRTATGLRTVASMQAQPASELTSKETLSSTGDWTWIQTLTHAATTSVENQEIQKKKPKPFNSLSTLLNASRKLMSPSEQELQIITLWLLIHSQATSKLTHKTDVLWLHFNCLMMCNR